MLILLLISINIQPVEKMIRLQCDCLFSLLFQNFEVCLSFNCPQWHSQVFLMKTIFPFEWHFLGLTPFAELNWFDINNLHQTHRSAPTDRLLLPFECPMLKQYFLTLLFHQLPYFIFWLITVFPGTCWELRHHFSTNPSNASGRKEEINNLSSPWPACHQPCHEYPLQSD